MRKSPSILIVEDELIVAEDLAETLEACGYGVSSIARTAEEAINEAERTNPDLVLMDIKLEGEMDGIEAASKIRSLLNIPVVFATAYADDTMLERAKTALPYGYLIKPFSRPELKTAVELALYKHEMEERVRESEERFRTVADFTYDWECWVGNAGEVLYVSPSCERITGYSPHDFIDDPTLFERITHPEDRPVVEEHFLGAVGKDDAGPWNFEFRIINKNGDMRWIDHVSQAVFGPRGVSLGRRCSNRDITEHKKAEEALANSEKLFRTLVETATDVIWTLNVDLKYTYASPSVNALLGYTVDEIMSLDPLDTLTPTSRGRVIQAFSEELGRDGIEPGQGRAVRLEDIEQYRKDGSIVWLEIATTFLYDDDSQVIGVLGISHDITHRKRAEQALLESEEKYRELAELLPQHVFEVDERGYFTFSNRIGSGTLGYTPEELAGRENILKVLIAEDHERAVEDFKRLVGGEKLTGTEYTLVHRDGNTTEVVTSIVPIMRDGTFAGARGVAVDISELKNMQEALRNANDELESRVRQRTSELLTSNEKLKQEIAEREKTQELLAQSQERLRGVVETAKDIILTVDLEFKPTYVNPAITTTLGYTVDEAMSMSFMDVLTPSSRERMWKAFQEEISKESMEPRHKLTSRTEEIEQYHRDGSIVWSEITYTFLRDGNGKPTDILGISRDITDRKGAERAVRESRKMLRLVLDSIPIRVFWKDLNSVYWGCNKAFAEDAGIRSPDEIVGETDGELAWTKHQADHFRACDRRVMESNVPEYHVVDLRLNRDGTRAWIDSTRVPMCDDDGEVVGILGAYEDVTERKSLEEQLRHAQKMQAIGTLAGGIAHDFNNILTPIIGYVEMALENVKKGSALHFDLQQILQAADRAAELVNQILTMSRQGEHDRRPVRITPIIKECLRFLRASLPKTVEIRHSVEADYDTILADPTRIHQVLMNLCTNAAQALEERTGMLEVSLSQVDLDTNFVSDYPDMTPGPYLRLRVGDTGHGIPPEILERMFDPYFTTRQPGEGTGLGLAVVHGIVKSHEGIITVDTELQKGSTFEVYFPILQEEEAGAQTTTDNTRPGGNERILFVDDEPAIVRMARMMLERTGYKVISRLSGKEALDLFQNNPDQFDLVITDMIMPRMTGKELCKELLKIRPDVPIILCTGFNEQVSVREAEELGIRAVVRKPLFRNELARTIRSALDAKEET